jgi:hypothetical protein
MFYISKQFNMPNVDFKPNKSILVNVSLENKRFDASFFTTHQNT